MKVPRNRRSTLLLIVFSVVIAWALPAAALGKGRERGWGQEKKWDKFINRHDARDGRWDGRGSRINRRDFRDDGFFVGRWPRARRDRFDRDFDRDDFRRFNRINRFERRSWRWNHEHPHQWGNASRWRTWR